MRTWGDDPRVRGKVIRINPYGFHDDSFPRQKPKGEFRGLFLGDSITMGHRVRASETFANQLEGLLEEHDTRHRSHQMINAGVQGYSTYQELRILEESMVFAPDFIFIGFCMNDVTMPFEMDRDLGGTGVFGNHTGQVTQLSNPLLGYLLNETGYGRLTHYLLGATELALGEDQRAFAALIRAAELGLDRPDAYAELPRLGRRLGLLNRVRETLLGLVERDVPLDNGTYVQIGRALRALGEEAGADLASSKAGAGEEHGLSD